MNSKKIITIILLVFVVGSVGAMIYKELQPGQTDPDAITADISTENVPQNQIIAYYFHGNQRCPTCMNIEAYTKESLETNFKEPLDSGRVVWQPINIDEAANRHFITDFELEMKLVVLADIKDGKQIQWKKLDQVWPLSGDKPGFLEYIKVETEEYLKESV